MLATARPRAKFSLLNTTAIASVALAPLTPISVVNAANIVISTTVGASQILGAGDTLTVTNSGVLNVGATQAVSVAGAITTGAITNSGLIAGNSTGISVSGNSNIGGALTNNSGATISGNTNGIVVANTSNISGGIINSGTISSGFTGVFVTFASDLSGGITNNSGGTLSGAINGISVNNSSDISGLISNSGTISGGTFGIRVSNNSDLSGGIINNAGGSITGGQNGIHLINADISGGIENNGTINGTINGIRVSNNSDLSGGIINTGTISGGNYGITLTTMSDISGDIVNSGTISGTDGIFVQSSTISGSIINSGTISGASSGIYVFITSDLSGGITNNSSGTISGNLHGIRVTTNSNISGGITNAGTIAGLQSGISVANGSDIAGGITNSGTISGNDFGIAVETNADIGGAINNNGTITGGIAAFHVFDTTLTGALTNSGTLSSGSGVGILITNTSDISAGLTNSASGIIAGLTNGISVQTGSDLSGGLINSGQISSADGAAIRSVSNSDISGGITNNAGGIIAGDSVGALVLNTSDISGGITNSGTITGVKGIRISAGSAISGGITNNVGGIIQGTGGIAIDLNGLSAATPITINGGRIIGDVIDSNTALGFSDTTIGGDFTTEGDFTVSDLVVTGGNTLTISGGNTVTLRDMSTSAGTFDFGVTDGVAGQLIVTNGNVDFTGATLSVNFNGANLRVGDEVLLADGNAPLLNTAGGVGLVATALPDQSYLLDSIIADGSQAVITTGGADNTQLYLTLIQAHTVEESGTNPNNQNAGGALDTLLTSTDPVLSQVVDNLNNASTQAGVNAIVAQTLPTVDGGAVVAGLTLAGKSFDLAGAKLTATREGGSGLATGNMGEGLRAWGQVFGEKGTQDRTSSTEGYDSETVGIAVGFDTQNINERTVAGVAFSYGNTQVESSNANNTETEVNGYQFTLYGDYDIDELTYISGLLGYVYGENESTRHHVGGTNFNAQADYASHQYAAEVKAGRSFYTDAGIKITPSALAHYAHYSAEDYTETGAGGANLDVQNEALNVLEVGAGLDVSWESLQVGGAVVKPEFRAGYRYDLIGDPVVTTARFTGGGPSFQTDGLEPAQSSFNLGTGLGYVTPYGWEFVVSYDYEYKEDYTGHSAFIKAGYKF